MTTTHTLTGKVAVMTGGSSGIGFAAAQQLVAAGASVFITGRRQDALEAAVAQLGHNVTAVQGYVTNLDDLDRLYRTVAAEKGVVDIVFANAGFVELRTIDAVTPAHFDKTVTIKMRGLLFTVQKALQLMKHGGVMGCPSTTSTVLPRRPAFVREDVGRGSVRLKEVR
jgi:NAD(P)-dependent dehydrogenase (short-subunit alcohol dehydrogenase family)